METSLFDHDGRIIFLFGTNDPKVSHVSQALLRRGDVFLDIGANYGSIGLMAAHAVGKAGRIHLFEPQRLLGERVKSAIEAGGYRNVKLHNIGLLDEDGMFTLESPLQHSGMATFSNSRCKNDEEDREEVDRQSAKETCQVRNISDYVPSLIKGKSSGVKLDIEGVEPKVMPWLLSQHNLRFLIFEGARNQHELYADVNDSGMSLFGLRRHPIILQVVRVDTFEEMNNYHDLLAVRLPHGMNVPKKINPYKLGALLSTKDRDFGSN